MADLTPAERAAAERFQPECWCAPELCDECEAKGRAFVALVRPLIEADALREFADANRFPSDWVMFRGANGSSVTVPDLLREAAAGKLGEPAGHVASKEAALTDLTARHERVKAARGLADGDLPEGPGALQAVAELLEDMVLEVDRLGAHNGVLVTEIRHQANLAEDAKAGREKARGIAVRLEQQLGEMEGRFERSQADLGEAWATVEKLKAGVARQRETIDSLGRIAYDEMWGERFPHRDHKADDDRGGPDCAGCWGDMILQAIGEEPKDEKLAALFDVPADRQARLGSIGLGDLAVMLDEVLKHVTALPSNMFYRSRIPAARPAPSETPTPARPTANDRTTHHPAGTRSASRYVVDKATRSRFQENLERMGPDVLDAFKVGLRAAAEKMLREQGHGLGAPAPTVRDVMAAAYRNGLGLHKRIDQTDEDGDGRQWRLREWDITNPHRRVIGAFELEEGPNGTHARLTSRRNSESGKQLYAEPTPGVLLAAARAAGLITK
ncbi:hypothetical protein AB0B28_08210 [Glycomyces sp. NPDC046736]|uniref:hypothetical protein n=1 Tax=Glycomyces sp. NPDC046736 TaxID=3155615 RepID=UPI0033CA13AE